jgi:heme-degrading monooxygenase HmoA
MILREWRGRTEPERADAYPAHFVHRVVPELRHIQGFVGAELLRHDGGNVVEFTVLSRWTSMEAIRAFAGSDPGRAVVEPGAVAALSDFDEHVTHHMVLEVVPLGPR